MNCLLQGSGEFVQKKVADLKKVLCWWGWKPKSCNVMNHTRLTSALLIGVFALIILATSAQAQRPTRGEVFIPPAPEPPAASKL